MHSRILANINKKKIGAFVRRARGATPSPGPWRSRPVLEVCGRSDRDGRAMPTARRRDGADTESPDLSRGCVSPEFGLRQNGEGLLPRPIFAFAIASACLVNMTT